MIEFETNVLRECGLFSNYDDDLIGGVWICVFIYRFGETRSTRGSPSTLTLYFLVQNNFVSLSN